MKTGTTYLSLVIAALLAITPAQAAGKDTERDFEIALTKGQYAVELGEYTAAIGHLERALELKPGDQEARVSLGIAYARSGDAARARAVLEKAVAKDGNDSRARYELAQVLAGLGHEDEARHMMRIVAETTRDEALSGAAQGFLAGRDEQRARPSLTLSAGAQYDSNVILEQDDPVAPSTQDKADWRGVFVIEGTYPFGVTERTGARAGYRFYQSLHATWEDFNVQQHRASLGGHYAFTRSSQLDLGYEFAYSYLGGERYSASHRIAPALSVSLTGRSLTELHAAYEAKKFFNTPVFTALSDKDGSNTSAGITHTLMAGTKTALSFDYTYDAESAEKAYWKYTGHRGAVSLLGGLGAYTVAASLAYHDRKYDGVPPGGAAKRHDGTQELSASIARKAGKTVTITLSDQYTFNDSNLPLYEYTRNIAGLFVEVAL